VGLPRSTGRQSAGSSCLRAVDGAVTKLVDRSRGAGLAAVPRPVPKPSVTGHPSKRVAPWCLGRARARTSASGPSSAPDSAIWLRLTTAWDWAVVRSPVEQKAAGTAGDALPGCPGPIYLLAVASAGCRRATYVPFWPGGGGSEAAVRSRDYGRSSGGDRLRSGPRGRSGRLQLVPPSIGTSTPVTSNRSPPRRT